MKLSGLHIAVVIFCATLGGVCQEGEIPPAEAPRNSGAENRTSDLGAGYSITPHRRLRDFIEDWQYPPFNRPAAADTPGLDNWPGYQGPRRHDAKILGFLGEELREGSLYIRFAAEAKRPGRFTFDTVLLTFAGGKPGKKVATSSVTRDLPAGRSELEFLFYGKIFRDAERRGLGGPFYIPGIIGQRTANDRELDALGRAELDYKPEGILTPLKKPFTTASYEAKKFTSRPYDSPEKRKKIKELKAEIKEYDRLKSAKKNKSP